jgi:drug/metabolite transporter (DMT)-like permease
MLGRNGEGTAGTARWLARTALASGHLICARCRLHCAIHFYLKSVERNPYSPPENIEITFMRELPPRPFSAWLVMGLLGVFFMIYALEAFRFLEAIASPRVEVRNGFGVAATLLSRFALMALLAAATWGIFERHTWSRWLGVAVLVGLIGVCLFTRDTSHYVNEAERYGGYVGRQFVFPVLLACLTYAFGFSAATRRYFAKSD